MKKYSLSLFLIIAFFSCTKNDSKQFAGCYTCSGVKTSNIRIYTSNPFGYTDTVIIILAAEEICINTFEKDFFLLEYVNDSLNQLNTSLKLNSDNTFTRNDENPINTLEGLFDIQNLEISFEHIAVSSGTIKVIYKFNCKKND